MDILAIILVILILDAVIFGFLGGWVAGQKARDITSGVVLGAIFGPFGVLIVALLPNGGGERAPSQPSSSSWDDASELPWLDEFGGEKTLRPEEAWLKQLEDRHRSSNGRTNP